MDENTIATLQRVERKLRELTILRVRREEEERENEKLPMAEWDFTVTAALEDRHKELRDMLRPVHRLFVKYSDDLGCYVLCSD